MLNVSQKCVGYDADFLHLTSILLFLAEFQFYEGQRFLTFWVRTCGKLRRLILTRQGSSTPDSRLFGKLGFISACSAVPGFSIFWLISWGGGHLQHCVRRIQAQAQSTETLLIFYRGNLHKNWPVSCLARRDWSGGSTSHAGHKGDSENITMSHEKKTS